LLQGITTGIAITTNRPQLRCYKELPPELLILQTSRSYAATRNYHRKCYYNKQAAATLLQGITTGIAITTNRPQLRCYKELPPELLLLQTGRSYAATRNYHRNCYYNKLVAATLLQGITTGIAITTNRSQLRCYKELPPELLLLQTGPSYAATRNYHRNCYYYKQVVATLLQGITTGIAITTNRSQLRCYKELPPELLLLQTGRSYAATRNYHRKCYYYKQVAATLLQGITTGIANTTNRSQLRCYRELPPELILQQTGRSYAATRNYNRNCYYYKQVAATLLQGITTGIAITTN
jgi:hypothetical protein